MALATCGLWDGWSLVINMEMQQPYKSHTWHPISLGLLPARVTSAPGCRRMKRSAREPASPVKLGQKLYDASNFYKMALLQFIELPFKRLTGNEIMERKKRSLTTLDSFKICFTPRIPLLPKKLQRRRSSKFLGRQSCNILRTAQGFAASRELQTF